MSKLSQQRAAIMQDELYHFGIKGQKWGVRKYQNEDGTYTSEGKLRRRKNYEDLSDKELDKYLSRRRKERELHQIDRETRKKSVGEKAVNGLKTAAGIAGSVSALYIFYDKYGDRQPVKEVVDAGKTAVDTAVNAVGDLLYDIRS